MLRSSQTSIRKNPARLIRLEQEDSEFALLESDKAYWWRFSRYAVRDGRIAPESQREPQKFDPSSIDPKPHIALVNLVHKHKLPTSGRQVSDLQLESILDWCRIYGLLGILPAKLRQLRCWPSWATYEPSGQAGILLETQVRTPKGWATESRFIFNSFGQGKHGDLCTREQINSFMGANGSDYPSLVVQNEFLEQHSPHHAKIHRYFMSESHLDKDQRFYPQAGTDAFWLDYCEPIEEFLSLAHALSKIATDIHSENLEEKHAAAESLNRYLSDVHPFVTLMEDGSFKAGFTGHSLIHTIARGIQADALKGLAPRKCQGCGQLFHDADTRQRYCTRSCQSRATSRAHYNRKATASKRADKPKHSK